MAIDSGALRLIAAVLKDAAKEARTGDIGAVHWLADDTIGGLSLQIVAAGLNVLPSHTRELLGMCDYCAILGRELTATRAELARLRASAADVGKVDKGMPKKMSLRVPRRESDARPIAAD